MPGRNPVTPDLCRANRAQLEKLIRLNKTRADFAEKFEGLAKLGVQFKAGAPDFFNAYQAAVTTTTGMATEAAARLSGATLKRTPPATAIASRPANC